MKIDWDKSLTVKKIMAHLKKYDEVEQMDILTQLCIKYYVRNQIKKKDFIHVMSNFYDAVEENANSLGII